MVRRSVWSLRVEPPVLDALERGLAAMKGIPVVSAKLFLQSIPEPILAGIMAHSEPLIEAISDENHPQDLSPAEPQSTLDLSQEIGTKDTETIGTSILPKLTVYRFASYV